MGCGGNRSILFWEVAMQIAIKDLTGAIGAMKLKSESSLMLTKDGKLVLSDNFKTVPVSFSGEPVAKNCFFDAKLFLNALKTAQKQGVEFVRVSAPDKKTLQHQFENVLIDGTGVEFVGFAETVFTTPRNVQDFDSVLDFEVFNKVELFLSRDDVRGMAAHTDKDRASFPGLCLSKNGVVVTNGYAAISLKRRVRGLESGAIHFENVFTSALEKSLPAKGSGRVVIGFAENEKDFLATVDGVQIKGYSWPMDEILADRLPMPKTSFTYFFDIKELKRLLKSIAFGDSVKFEGLTVYAYDADRGESVHSFQAGVEGDATRFVLNGKKLKAMIAAFPTKTKTVEMRVEAGDYSAVHFVVDADSRTYLLAGLRQ
jgi:hypothetical protein